MNTTHTLDLSNFYVPRPTLQYFMLNLITASLFSVWWQVNLVKEVNRQLGREQCDIRWFWGLVILGSWVSFPCLYTGVGIPAVISLIGLLYFWIHFAFSVAAAMNEMFANANIPVRASKLWITLFGSVYQYYLLVNLEALIEKNKTAAGNA